MLGTYWVLSKYLLGVMVLVLWVLLYLLKWAKSVVLGSSS